jgi:hypothetical protein
MIKPSTIIHGLVILFLNASTVYAQNNTNAYPLDPLTATEIKKLSKY